MSEETVSVTQQYLAASAAADMVDFEKQYCVPDFARSLRAAYIHGYVQAMNDPRITERPTSTPREGT